MTLQDAPLPLAPMATSRLELLNDVVEIRNPGGLIACSPAMCALLEELDRLLDSPQVLLEGETGTGKDLMARVLHDRTCTGSQPLLELDAPALGANRLAAELVRLSPAKTGGTLLIREVADLASEHQSLLLEELDSIAPGSGRIVCLTQRDLDKEVWRRSFLPALWERLQPVTLRVPPLRERREDLPHLIRYFLQMLADRYRRQPVELTDQAWQILLEHRWEGNVRELQNEIERLIVFASGDGPVGPSGLSAAVQPEPKVRTMSRLRQQRKAVAERGRWVHPANRRARVLAASSLEGRIASCWPGRPRRRARR